MKQIPLWRRKLTPWNLPPTLVPFKEPRYALVDDEDFDWLNEHRWFLADGSDYIQGYVDSSYVTMHRTIMQRWRPCDDPDSWDVHHKDKNKLHNNRANLERTPCKQPKHHLGRQRLSITGS